MILAVSVSSALAATVTVQPGVDTIQAAHDAASNSDVLELEDGVYTSASNALSITKAITIQAKNARQVTLNGITIKYEGSSTQDYFLSGLVITGGSNSVRTASTLPRRSMRAEANCGLCARTLCAHAPRAHDLGARRPRLPSATRTPHTPTLTHTHTHHVRAPSTRRLTLLSSHAVRVASCLMHRHVRLSVLHRRWSPRSK